MLNRTFDIIFSIFVIVSLLPLMFLIAVIIKLTSKGKIIFKQKRVGLNGRKFYIYKFRTMYENNDEILRKYLQTNYEARKEWELYRKLKNYDPRITPIGKFLRRYSLDELPQFFNVLKGDMSVVGPRPYIEEEIKELDKELLEKILSVKPGITGLWQVEGRNDLPFQERVKKDLEYIEKKTFIFDLKIIFKTIRVIFTSKGAY